VQLSVKGEKTKTGGYFDDELDAGKRVNEMCEELEIPLQNPKISAIPSQQYQKKEKSSQYKGVSLDKHTKKWRVQVRAKGKSKAWGGYFQDELDAAKRVNQQCEELGIPAKNPGIIVEMPTQQSPHGDYSQTITNPVISSEILTIDNDEAKKKKRKRKKELNKDDELPGQKQYYFYENLLNFK